MFEDDLLTYPDRAELHTQMAGWHLATLKDLKHPTGQGHGLWEVENLQATGKDNWTNWAPSLGNQISGSEQRLASGMWWPGQPGDMGYVGFTGDFLQPIVLPGLSQATEPKDKKAILPGEVKTVADKNIRQSTRMYKLSSPAGSGITISDIAGKEFASFGSWTGAHLIFIEPGKGQDEEEEEGAESKPRSAYTREDNMSATQTSQAPSAILKSGQGVVSLQDMNGSGIMLFASDGAGTLTIQANGANGSVDGPSLVLDSKNNLIVMTAGTAQATLNGPKGQFETCKSVIQEKIRIPVETTHQKFKDFSKNNMKYYCKACGGG